MPHMIVMTNWPVVIYSQGMSCNESGDAALGRRGCNFFMHGN